MRRFTKFLAGVGVLVCLAGALRAQVPIWDTLTTQCTRLVVDDRGEVGLTKLEGVNLDFVALGGDCDLSANVYLFSGGPFAIRKNGSSYVYSSSVWQSNLMNSTGWDLMPSGQTPGPISGPGYTGFQTSTMWNADHTIAVQKTYYTPSVSDSCNFIIQKSVFFGVGGPKTNVTIGEIIDWDVPANGAAPGFNTSGLLFTNAVYQRGIGTTGCQPDQNRYAALVHLGMFSPLEQLTDPCANSRDFYGELTWSVDTLLKRIDTLSNSDQGNYYWNLTGVNGLSGSSGQLDLATLLTYKHNRTLDTLIVYTALVSVQNGDVSVLAASVSKARAFYKNTVRGCDAITNCCLENSIDGRTGNVDCSPDKKVDISDLVRIIECLYLPWPWPNPCFCCPEAANMDGDIGGGFDISDLSALIDYLYISFTPLAPCPNGSFD